MRVTRHPKRILHPGWLAAVVACLVLTTAQAQPAHVRQSLHEFVRSPDNLWSLIRGVAVMRQRNAAPKDSAEYRTSWEYWAAIHGYPGATSPFGTIEQTKQRLLAGAPLDAPLFEGFFSGLENLTPPSEPAGLAQSIWSTCKHSSQTEQAVHFLSWHRMYLYFFERVLRDASGDPSFALPYWDYTNPTVDPADPANAPSRIPVAFVADVPVDVGSGPVPNPLFERRRTAGFGRSVHLDVVRTDIDATLAIDTFVDFQATLEGGIHGFIHCAVGNRCLAPYIGLVPFAGADPVFWHHHANIDRIWSCWSKRYGVDRNPINDMDWMSEEFHFVNERGDPVSMKVGELFDPAGRIDYAYDNDADCSRQPPVVEMAAMTGVFSEENAQIRVSSDVASANDVAITAVEQSIELEQASLASPEMLLLAMRPTTVAPTKATLRLIGVQTDREPGASINVFLTDSETERRVFVGVIGFFALFDHQANGEGRGRDLSYDVSGQLQELSADAQTTDQVRVLLEASTGLTGDDAEIDAGRYAESGIRIKRVTLEVETSSQVFDLK